MIQCSERCVHESDGLCSLREVTSPSKTPKKDCPYYSNKHKSNNVVNEDTPPPLH